MKKFSFRWEFDGNLQSLLRGVMEGDAVSFNDASIPIRNATMQGKRLLLPLPHRIVEIDLTHACRVSSRSKPTTLELEFVDGSQ